ncbi:MAG: methyltransferase domain-containing protein [Clostridia bacterium]|nr:methyltransferase domain-containing protein [Clostridia bacterium]
MLFVCPKCMQKLNTEEGRAVCERGHSYDRSRHGYYNLLLSGSGGTHGDNREMVLARRAFLDTGAYSPLADKLAELVSRHLVPGGVLLDVGMGEGYYTAHIAARLDETGVPYTLLGFDISKDAARYAAKRVRGTVAVASAYRMPLASSSVDLALNVFSPLAHSELCRTVKSGGRFIMAIPNRRHLFGLKRELYREPYENEVAADVLGGFKLLERTELSYEITLGSSEQIQSLFMMTPYAYRTPPTAREHLGSLDTLTTEVEFIIFVYERDGT